MTFRERLLAVFNGERPDALPWFADLSYWRWAHLSLGDLPEAYRDDEGYVKLHRDYHAGIYLGFTGAYRGAGGAENVTITQRTEGHTTITRWATPVGEMEGR
jgi:hypothetical protein